MPMAGSNSTPQNVNANSNSNNTMGAGGGGVNANNTPSAATATVGTNKTWELSDYELHRTPQEAITDGSEIAVSPRALHSELMCPICLDMLHNTMTTKECLHRFCAECIITALRSGNKECPTCRKKLVSKRSLRHDPNFDQLISKIYPSRDEYEAQQQKAMARLSKSHNQLALASSIEEGLKAQSQLRKPIKPIGKGSGQQAQNSDQQQDNVDAVTINETLSTATNGQQPQQTTTNSLMNMSSNSLSHQIVNNGGIGVASAPAGVGPSPAKISRTDSVGGGNSSNTSGYSEEVTEVELVFKPHPDMISNNGGIAAAEAVQNQTRFIKTTANASVEHLAKYLGMRLALDSQMGTTGSANNSTSTLHNCTIYVSPYTNENNFIVVPQNHTLAQVCEKYWRFNKPLEMYYSWKRV